MVLVAYSDSEGSDVEEATTSESKTVRQKSPPTARRNFTVDKVNPQKIRVNLKESSPAPTEREDGEPAAKRPRVGAGVFSGFNAMLPAPKRDNLPTTSSKGSKAPVRKVFSLKTGAEPAFSREADAEMRQPFDKQDAPEARDVYSANTIPSSIPKPSFPTETESTTATSKPFMFKPLSVGRNTKKKKPTSHVALPTIASAQPTSASSREPVTTHETPPDPPAPKKEKISLFSTGSTTLLQAPGESSSDLLEDEDEDEIVEVLDDDLDHYAAQTTSTAFAQPESLDSIADSLNLSAAERRQLLGRNGMSASASKVVNFNTDVEYAANQAHIAAGDQVQHNPVRSIAPGKHSLKSLVASAQGQKDALEESFASGRRNKKEAGSKYGW